MIKKIIALIFSLALISYIIFVFNASPRSLQFENKNLSKELLPQSSNPFEFHSSNADFLKNKEISVNDRAPISVEKWIEKNRTAAFIIIRNDTILYENYFDGNSRDQAHIIHSVSKSWVATTAAIAEKQGYFDLEDKVVDYLPYLKENLDDNLTIRDLMNMRSSLVFSEFGLIKPNGILRRLVHSKNLKQVLVNRTKQKAEPNTYFNYQSLSIQLLEFVIAEATKVSFVDYFNENLWNKLHPEYNAYLMTDTFRHARGFYGFAISAIDDAKLGKLILDKGRIGAEQILPDWFINDLLEINNRSKNAYQYTYSFRSTYKAFDMKEWEKTKNDYQEFQHVKINNRKEYVFVPNENRDIYAAGSNGNYIYVHPATNTIIVRRGIHQIFRLKEEILRAIATDQSTIKKSMPLLLKLEEIN